MRAPDDTPAEAKTQSFRTTRSPNAALDAAEAYLEGAGVVAAPLRGRMVRTGDDLVVHYGRIVTNISAHQAANGADVHIARRGRYPLEDTRRWVFGLGILGFALAWGLAWYNADAERALSPLVTITFFFMGIIATVVGLYVIDRSLERRGGEVLRSLEDAIKGDPLLVLQREVDGLERSSSVANAILFYCVGLFIEFIVFLILVSEKSIWETIDQDLTLAFMRAVFGLPIVPAVLFGLIWFAASNRLHNQRMALVERRLRALDPR